MSGIWVKLNDIRVRIDRPEYSSDYFWEMSRSLALLYDVSTTLGIEDSDYGDLDG